MAVKILLDAGHFGYRNQSPCVPEYWESRKMWVLCEYLAEELTKRGFEVSKTRDDVETFVDVFDRGCMAKGFDMFLSLHSNAVGPNGNESVDRVDVYGAYDNLNNSHEFANILAKEIAKVMQVSKGTVQTRKSEEREDEFYGVMRGARSVGCKLFYIVEHSFHTNEYAAKWLLQDENLRKLANAEADVILAYYTGFGVI